MEKNDAYLAMLDVKKFLEDCETCCFDCGASNSVADLTKLSDGVALCVVCLEIAEGDYPLEGGK